MNRLNYKKILSWLPAILLMILIFSFSAKEATASSAESSHLLDAILQFLEKQTGITVTPASDIYELLHTLLRKLGHFSEYAALGCALVLPFYTQGLRRLRLFLSCEVGATLYAASDEFHQLFVAGRDGNLTDVCIDAAGACTGIVFAFIILALFHRKSNPNR